MQRVSHPSFSTPHLVETITQAGYHCPPPYAQINWSALYKMVLVPGLSIDRYVGSTWNPTVYSNPEDGHIRMIFLMQFMHTNIVRMIKKQWVNTKKVLHRMNRMAILIIQSTRLCLWFIWIQITLFEIWVRKSEYPDLQLNLLRGHSEQVHPIYLMVDI